MKNKSNAELIEELLRLKQENISLKELSTEHAAQHKRINTLYNSQSLLNSSIINSLKDIIIFSIDSIYCYTSFNKKHQEEMRKVWDADIKIGENLLDYMKIPELRESAKCSIDKALRGESFLNTQAQPELDIYYEFVWNPILDKNNTVGVIVFIKDITERKLAEKEVQESKEKYQLLFSKAPLGYQSLDINGNFIEVNQQWSETLGYSRSEVLGTWFGDLLPPSSQDGFRERFPIFKSQGNIHSEFEMVHKNGNKVFIAFEGSIGYDTNGEFKQTHCILQDITQKKKAYDALKVSEDRLKFYIDNSPMGIIEWNSDFNITLWTSEAEKIFGWNSKEVIGRNFLDLDFIYEPDLHLVKKTLKELTKGEQYYVVSSNRNYRKDRSVINCEWYNTVLKNEKGEMQSVLSYVLDITERKKTEQKLLFISKAVEATNDAIGISDAQGHHFYQNKAFTDLFGYGSAEELEAAGGIAAVSTLPDANTEMFEILLKSIRGQMN